MPDHRPMLRKVCERIELFDRMLQRIGVPLVVVARLDQAQALHTTRAKCIECVHATKCREWLSRPLPEQSPPPPAFCPSGAFFRRLRGVGRN